MRRKRGAGEGERQKGEGEAPREAKGYAGSDFHSQSLLPLRSTESDLRCLAC